MPLPNVRDKGRSPKNAQLPVAIKVVENRIFVLRGRRAVLDRDLAELYGVETRVLNQAVKRNSDRFPEDFTFQLTLEEARDVLGPRSQTEAGQKFEISPVRLHGAVMLANVLKSKVAIRASIQVVRAFVRLA